jgi:hypothetical protein
MIAKQEGLEYKAALKSQKEVEKAPQSPDDAKSGAKKDDRAKSPIGAKKPLTLKGIALLNKLPRSPKSRFHSRLWRNGCF